MVLLGKSLDEILYCEFKSSKPNSLSEIKADIDRLSKLSIKSMFYYSGEVPAATKRLILQWSESQNEIDNNINSLSDSYAEIKFSKHIMDCEEAPLYCIYSEW